MPMSSNIEEDRQWARVASAIGTVLALDEQKRVPAGHKGGGQFTSGGGGGASTGGKETKKAKTKPAASEAKPTPKVKEAPAKEKAVTASVKKSTEKSKKDLTSSVASSKTETSQLGTPSRVTGPQKMKKQPFDRPEAMNWLRDHAVNLGKEPSFKSMKEAYAKKAGYNSYQQLLDDGGLSMEDHLQKRKEDRTSAANSTSKASAPKAEAKAKESRRGLGPKSILERKAEERDARAAAKVAKAEAAKPKGEKSETHVRLEKLQRRASLRPRDFVEAIMEEAEKEGMKVPSIQIKARTIPKLLSHFVKHSSEDELFRLGEKVKRQYSRTH